MVAFEIYAVAGLSCHARFLLENVSFEGKTALPIERHAIAQLPHAAPPVEKKERREQNASHNAEWHDNADPGLAGEEGVVQGVVARDVAVGGHICEIRGKGLSPSPNG